MIDAGKKTKGRERHIIVDTLGLIFALVVHPANIQDRDGGKLLIKQLGTRWRRLEVIWADGGDAGQFVDWAIGWYGRLIEIVKRADSHKFVVVAKRWIVERTQPPSNDRKQRATRLERATFSLEG